MLEPVVCSSLLKNGKEVKERKERKERKIKNTMEHNTFSEASITYPDFIEINREYFMRVTVEELETVNSRYAGKQVIYSYDRKNIQLYLSAYNMEFAPCSEFDLSKMRRIATKKQFDKQWIRTLIEQQQLDETETASISFLQSSDILLVRHPMNAEELKETYEDEIALLLTELEREEEYIQSAKNRKSWERALRYWNRFKYIDLILQEYFDIEFQTERDMIEQIQEGFLGERKWFYDAKKILEDIIVLTTQHISASQERIYLHVPFIAAEKAKSRGARFDKNEMMHYFTDRGDAWKFADWILVK